MTTEAQASRSQPFGRRISERRMAAGLTQQQLSARIAMSRAALSHLEAGITVASERSVCLLAGVFDLEPHELVAGSDYPIAKAERLPLFVARHTHVDLSLALLGNDLAWCARLQDQSLTTTLVDVVDEVGQPGQPVVDDPDERARLRDARTALLRRLPRDGTRR